MKMVVHSEALEHATHSEADNLACLRPLLQTVKRSRNLRNLVPESFYYQLTEAVWCAMASRLLQTRFLLGTLVAKMCFGRDCVSVKEHYPE